MIDKFSSSGKNIINKQGKEEKDNRFSLTQDGDMLHIDVSIPYLRQNGLYTFSEQVMALASLGSTKVASAVFDDIKRLDINNVGIMMENFPHYTGGRYTVWFHALLLSHYIDVTIYTNSVPKFRDDLYEYEESGKLKVVIDPNYGMGIEKNKHDLVIGVPQAGGFAARQYAQRHGIPYYLYLFESPNWMMLHREGEDAQEEYWKSYKEALKQAQAIITISNLGKRYISEWIEDSTKPIYVVNPLINEEVAKLVDRDRSKHEGYKFIKQSDNKYHIVFSSRSASFKTQTKWLKLLDKDLFTIHIIGKVWGSRYDFLVKKGYDIRFYDSVSDYDKMWLISECDAMIYMTDFEGWGMPPLEAMRFNIPTLTNRLPIFDEVYGDALCYYVEEKASFQNSLISMIENHQAQESKKLDGARDREMYWKILLDKYSVNNTLRRLLPVANIPYVSSGTIVYNGDDYLEHAIKSIYDTVSEIIIVEGRVKGYGKEGKKAHHTSTDASCSVISALVDKDTLGKIKAVTGLPRTWKDKVEMQNEIAKRVTGAYYVKVDADEIWKEGELLKVVRYLERNKKVEVIRMPFHHFWLNFNTVAKDANGKWSTKHPRVWRWRLGYKHSTSFNHFVTGDSISIAVVPDNGFLHEDWEGDSIYHFGYVRELKKLQEKIGYYDSRGIEKYAIDTVTNYKQGSNERTQPTQAKEVRSWAEEFDGTLPKVLDDHPYKNVKDIRKI